MSPDPVDDDAGISVDVMDTDVRDAEPAIEDSAYVRSYLRSLCRQGDADDRAPVRADRDIADVAEDED